MDMQFTELNKVPVRLYEPALPSIPTKEQIFAFEAELLKFPQAVFHVEHHFTPGIYARELKIPAGGLLTGKVHRYEHLNVCNGDITVWTDEGMKRLTGFHVIKSSPGTKRVGYAHSDTVWITFHHNPDDVQDLQVIEAEHIESVSLPLGKVEVLS